MNGLERIAAAMSGQVADRRAVALTLSLYGAKLTGCPLKRYYRDSIAYAEGQLAAFERFGSDVVYSPFALALEGEALGCAVKWHERQPPAIAKPLSRGPGVVDLDKIDFDGQPFYRYAIGVVERLARDLNGRAALVAVATSPADIPALLFGVESWLDMLLFDPEAAALLLASAGRYFARFANSLLEAGATAVALPSVFLNPSVVSVNIAKRLPIPAMREAFAQVRGPLILHHGGVPIAPFLPLYREMPNTIGFVLDPRDKFQQARALIGADLLLIGGVDGPALDGRAPDQAEAEAQAALRAMDGDARSILATAAADIPWSASEETIAAIPRAAGEYDRKAAAH